MIVVDQLTTETLQQALRAGVRDVLTLSGEPGQLAAAVERVAMGLDTTGRRPTSGSADGTVGMDHPEMNGRVITVFSTKGGAGKSVISTNLAITLAQRTQLRSPMQGSGDER